MTTAKHPRPLPYAVVKRTARLSGRFLLCSNDPAFPCVTSQKNAPIPKDQGAKSRLSVRGRETRLALGCSLRCWATVGRLGCPKSAIGRQLNLVLPDFRNLAIGEPVSNGRRLNADRSSDLGLAAKVFKKVIRGHATSISHALRNVQEK